MLIMHQKVVSNEAMRPFKESSHNRMERIGQINKGD